MSPFAEAALAAAQRRLDNALAALEEYADRGNPVVLGTAYAELLRVKGHLHAVTKLEEMAEEATLIEAARVAS